MMILVLRVKEYVSEKLWNPAALDMVDWISRGKEVVVLTPLFKVWLSKSFTNFSTTSYKMKQ